MAGREYSLELANFVCKFGEQNLVDYLWEIVLPAFSDKALQRKYGNKAYFFTDVTLVYVGPETDRKLAIVGRFIKDTLLEREQLYVDGALITDHKELKSSPSSVFLLILDVHRLLFIKETQYAPSLEQFETAIIQFLQEKHTQFITKLHQAAVALPIRPSDAELRQKHRFPSLQIIPLSSAQSIESFVRKYDVLRSVTYVFADRNDEQDNDAFFDAVQRQRDSVGSDKTKIIHHSTDGLDKEHVINEVQSATKQGTQHVKLSGKDPNGNKLDGDNKSFTLRKKVNIEQKDPISIAGSLFQAFGELLQEGIVTIPTPSAHVKGKLEEFVRRLNGQ